MPRPSSPTSALYVRLPAAQADKLDRAARSLGVPKTALVTGLVSALAEPDSEGASGDPGEVTPRRVAVGSGGEPVTLGSYSFRPYELPEVLTAQQAAQLLQLTEQVVVQLAEAGQIPGRSLGGSWRFSRVALVAWLSHGAEPDG